MVSEEADKHCVQFAAQKQERTSEGSRSMVSEEAEKHCARRAAHLAGTRMSDRKPALPRISAAVGGNCMHRVVCW